LKRKVWLYHRHAAEKQQHLLSRLRRRHAVLAARVAWLGFLGWGFGYLIGIWVAAQGQRMLPKFTHTDRAGIKHLSEFVPSRIIYSCARLRNH